MEIGNFPVKQFRIMKIKMIQDLGNRMKKMQGMLNKDLEGLKNRPTELNNTLEGIRSRITDTEKIINVLKDRMLEITATKQNIEKK